MAVNGSVPKLQTKSNALFSNRAKTIRDVLAGGSSFGAGRRELGVNLRGEMED